MAKGQLRGNRETKKPKQDKKPTPPTAGVPWTTPPKTTAVGKPEKKK